MSDGVSDPVNDAVNDALDNAETGPGVDSDGNRTQAGQTRPAGAGLTDEQFAERVSGQTSNDLKAEDVFEREADGAVTEQPAADVTADELA